VQLPPRFLKRSFPTVVDAILLPHAVLRLLEASSIKEAFFSVSVVVRSLRLRVIRLLLLESRHILISFV
jgi:hypothetical protein